MGQGQEPILQAVITGDLMKLIESYKNGGSLLIQGPDHCSLLHYAAKTGNGEIVKYILDHARRTTVLLRQDDSAVSLPSASSLHICAAFVPWQGRIWNGLLAASGRLMGNEILERGCGAMEGIAEEIWMH
ncbi:hypothetical protein ACRRTK_015849 [Alexandromys fortis]